MAGLVESLIALAVLLRLPADQDTAWLLGYSRNRWILFGAIFYILVVFAGSSYWLRKANAKAKIASLPARLPNHFFTDLVKLIILILCGLWLSYNQYFVRIAEESIFLWQRIMPLFVLAVLLGFQSLALVLYMNQATNEMAWIETIFSFPRADALLFKIENGIYISTAKIAEKSNRFILISLVLIWPLAFNALLSWSLYSTSVTDFVVNNADEVKYWLEAAAFKAGNFNGGQHAGSLGSSRRRPVAEDDSGAHGPFFAILQGGAGKLIGWQTYTPVLMNIIVLAFALGIFLIVLKPDTQKLLVLWLLLATYLPIYVFIPSAMQQTLHQAFGLVAAALFVRWIVIDQESGFRWAVWLVVLVFFASLFRYSWALLYIPILLIGFFRLKRSVFHLLLGIITLCAGAAFAAANFFWAPYPIDIRFQIADAFQSGMLDGISAVWRNIARNFLQLFENNMPWVMVFRLQFGVQLISAVGILGYFIYNRKLHLSSPSEQLNLVHGLNISSIFILNLSFYYVRSWNDYRIWVPHLLLSMVLLLYAETRRAFWITLLIGIFAFGALGSVGALMDFAHMNDYPEVLTEIKAFTHQTEPYLKFDPEHNKWCHTVTISKYSLGDQNIRAALTGLPAGFGFMTIINWDTMRPEQFESKYVLANPAYVEGVAPGFLNSLDLEYLTSTSLGNLYLNPNSSCDH